MARVITDELDRDEGASHWNRFRVGFTLRREEGRESETVGFGCRYTRSSEGSKTSGDLVEEGQQPDEHIFIGFR